MERATQNVQMCHERGRGHQGATELREFQNFVKQKQEVQLARESAEGLQEYAENGEEHSKLLRSAHHPALLEVPEIVHNVVQEIFRPEDPASVATLEEPEVSYAAMTRRPPPVSRKYQVSSRSDTPALQNDIFGGLVRNPPGTVEAFVTEATNIERALQARASHYQRHPSVAATALLGGENAPGTDIREIIREVVREELRQLLPAASRPATLSIAEAVREEVQRALQPEVPVTTVAPEEPTLSYAAMARRPPQAPRQATAPPRRDAPTPQYPRRQEDQAHVHPDRPAPRKTDVWRTADRRPLCYHCGEADHVYRRCPYRRLGLRGFHPNDPRPRYGERPREIDEYLRRPQSPEPASRREFRSPSPRRAATPGGGVAEDDRRQDPPRTSEGPHSNATGDRNDAPATVSNNLNVVIDGHDASALVDTGADYSVLSGRLSRRLRKVTTPWDGPQIRTAGGHLITPVGRCTARVEIHGETCPVKFVVLQDCSRDVILGMDFLCEYGAVIDLGANQLTLRKPVFRRWRPNDVNRGPSPRRPREPTAAVECFRTVGTDAAMRRSSSGRKPPTAPRKRNWRRKRRN
ncbi:hypothetical protein ISCGN_003056 [Ixodes scapularis]